jgi:pimeloyl-ACP methyl ester carboxylesterase
VLLIHGAGSSSAVWMTVLARLGRLTRAVAIDLPGHGPSPSPPADASGRVEPSLAALRDACGALAAALCLGRAVLVGHSMGALVALDAALAWPDKVAGLVLCAAAPRLPITPEAAQVLRDDAARFPTWLAERALSPAAKPAVRRGFVAAGIATTREAAAADYALIAATDLSSRVGGLTCPVVWIDGADDTLVPAAPGRRGEVITLPGVGHLTPIEAPSAVAETAARLARETAA